MGRVSASLRGALQRLLHFSKYCCWFVYVTAGGTMPTMVSPDTWRYVFVDGIEAQGSHRGRDQPALCQSYLFP